MLKSDEAYGEYVFLFGIICLSDFVSKSQLVNQMTIQF